MRGNNSEILILVDSQDRKTGEMEKTLCHHFPGYLHRAFLTMVFNPRGELLMARRSKKKLLWSGIWDGSVASHPMIGERLKQAARRRLKEEAGIANPIDLKKILKFQYEASWQNKGVEKEICAVFSCSFDGEVKTNPEEIDGFHWISLGKLDKELKNFPQKYSPWLVLAFNRLE